MIFETIIVSDIDKLSSEKLLYYGIIFLFSLNVINIIHFELKNKISFLLTLQEGASGMDIE